MTAKAETADLFVIGGGINGCGIARDAAGRGLSVVLAEKGDLAQATSSASTKLFHGGLRYLEYFEFRLVREALEERETLLAAMPHISWPMRFVLPYSPDMRFESDTPTARLLGRVIPGMRGRRPAWLIRLGLFLYDTLGGRKLLPPTRTLDLATDPAGRALKPEFRRAWEYSDCWVEDSRLVALNARDAAARGARILVGTRVVAARRDGELWRVTTEDALGPRRAPGARARQRRGPLGRRGAARHRPRRHPGGRAARAGQPHRHAAALRPRPLLFLPGERRADHLRDSLRAGLHPDRDDRRRPSRAPRGRGLLRCGARLSPRLRLALLRDAGDGRGRGLDLLRRAPALRRRRHLGDGGDTRLRPRPRRRRRPGAPLLTVFGGKITTYRRLAEGALARLAPFFPAAGGAWTARAPLPGRRLPRRRGRRPDREPRGALSLPLPLLGRAAGARLRHRGGGAARRRRQRRRPRARLRRDADRGRGALARRARVRPQRRRHPLAAQQARTATLAGGRGGAPRLRGRALRRSRARPSATKRGRHGADPRRRDAGGPRASPDPRRPTSPSTRGR